MTPVAFIRHGPTLWNAEKRIQGRIDEPLSEAGRKTVSAWRLPDEFKSWQWFVSPKVRARETARLLGLDPVADDSLQEMNWGDWEGERIPELRERYGEAMRTNEDRGLDFHPPNGESPRDVQARLKAWLAERGRDGVPAGAVCHAGVIRAVYCLASGWDMTGKPPVKMRDGCVQVFLTDGEGNLTIDRLNIPMGETT